MISKTETLANNYHSELPWAAWVAAPFCLQPSTLTHAGLSLLGLGTFAGFCWPLPLPRPAHFHDGS